MSAVIPAVTPVVTAAAAQPLPISDVPVNTATDGSTIAITTPDSSPTNPVVIAAPTSGSFTVAPATQGANVVVQGTGDATVNVGTAVDGSGNIQSAAGSTVQVDNDYSGSVIANFAGSPVGGTQVNVATDTGNGTIADNLPGGGAAALQSNPNAFASPSNIDLYINTGKGADQIEGSRGNDFIRAGAGNDVVNSGAGDDIVRTGSGTDEVTLGSGEDIVYFTVDQLQGTQSKTLTDFDANGNDKIQIDADLQDLVDISGQGTNKITITLSGAQTGTTTVESGGQTIDDDDIEFV